MSIDTIATQQEESIDLSRIPASITREEEYRTHWRSARRAETLKSFQKALAAMEPLLAARHAEAVELSAREQAKLEKQPYLAVDQFVYMQRQIALALQKLHTLQGYKSLPKAEAIDALADHDVWFTAHLGRFSPLDFATLVTGARVTDPDTGYSRDLRGLRWLEHPTYARVTATEEGYLLHYRGANIPLRAQTLVHLLVQQRPDSDERAPYAAGCVFPSGRRSEEQQMPTPNGYTFIVEHREPGKSLSFIDASGTQQTLDGPTRFSMDWTLYDTCVLHILYALDPARYSAYREKNATRLACFGPDPVVVDEATGEERVKVTIPANEVEMHRLHMLSLYRRKPAKERDRLFTTRGGYLFNFTPEGLLDGALYRQQWYHDKEVRAAERLRQRSSSAAPTAASEQQVAEEPALPDFPDE